MRLIDISLPVSGHLLTWPGDPACSVTRTSDMNQGDVANVSRIDLGSHAGTHIDPPLHFLPGAAAADRIPLDALVGAAHVVDARGLRGPIGREALAAIVPDAAERVLVRSDNSALWRQERPAFPDDYVSLAPDAAEWLVERGVRCVGIDFLSIEQQDAPGHPTHTTLLSAGVVIIEGLDLWEAEPGVYTLMCLPLRIAGGDGAPARAVLLQP